MPSKTSKKKAAAALPSIPKELIDHIYTTNAIESINGGWAAKDWKVAMNQFSILYAERFEAARG